MKCSLCGRQTDIGADIYCGRCDRIVGDVNANIATELED